MTSQRFEIAWRDYCDQSRMRMALPRTLSESQAENVLLSANNRLRSMRCERQSERIAYWGALTALAATITLAIALNPEPAISSAEPIALSDLWQWEATP